MIAHEKYRLAHRLGSGGMADVFRGEITGAEGFSRPVAIKRLHAAVSADPDFCAMFVREARLLAALQHPNIVSVLDFEWDAEARLFLVLELVDGINLAQLARSGPLPVPVAVHVIAEVLRGLGHAHARGILHRDVTPHNVLLAWTGEIKLTDFGLAQASSSSRVSDRGSIRGKVPYLSPEQLQGLAVDARSDLFSVGVMFYQLLTGRYPFFGRGDHPTVAESIARMLTATIVPPRDLRPEMPPALSDLIMRLLDRERDHRHTSTEQVLAALPATSAGLPSVAALLSERFPGHTAAEPEPHTVPPRASPPADPLAGQHQTTSRPGDLTPQPRGWRRSAPLLLLAVPLVWLAAARWPAGAVDEAAGQAVADMRSQDVAAAEAAVGALLVHVDAGVAPDATALQHRGASVAPGHVADPAPARPAGDEPTRHGRLSASSHSSAPTSTPGLDIDDPLPPPTETIAAPVIDEATTKPASPRYDERWFVDLPRQVVSGEVPIQRTERR